MPLTAPEVYPYLVRIAVGVSGRIERNVVLGVGDGRSFDSLAVEVWSRNDRLSGEGLYLRQFLDRIG